MHCALHWAATDVSYNVDAVVIGAGIIGLACARRLAESGFETIVIESQKTFGQGISSRNSEVIHAGLYYKPGSLKARLCRDGRDRLYRYCEERHIPHRRVGKLVVATNEAQLEGLRAIQEVAEVNGCSDLKWLDANTARKWEPALSCVAALHSPSTGIVDCHALMTTLLGDAEAAGALLVRNTPIIGGAIEGNRIRLNTGGPDATQIHSPIVINAAGLEAPAIASNLSGFPETCVPPRCYAKGNYFSLTGNSPFSRLIYPVPERGGLGVHLTLDLMGRARFGPDVEWIDTPEYAVDASKAPRFLEAIRQYWPDCTLDRLLPAYAGVRPKLGSSAAFADDFVIQSVETHGINGLVNLFGIESPGLTSCLAIAEEVSRRLHIH